MKFVLILSFAWGVLFFAGCPQHVEVEPARDSHTASPPPAGVEANPAQPQSARPAAP